MIEEEPRVEVVLEIDAKLQSAFAYHMKVRLFVELLVLLAALGATARAHLDALRRHPGHLRQDREHLAAPSAHGFQLDLGRCRILLHVEPLLLRLEGAIDVDRKGVLGHVRVVRAVAGDLFPLRPAAQSLQVLRQTIREHARAGAVLQMRDALAEHAHFTRAVRLHLDAQQPALDAAVPDGVRAIGAQPEFLAQFRARR